MTRRIAGKAEFRVIKPFPLTPTLSHGGEREIKDMDY
jgi:hypothetical protein